ncbi:MAG: FAD-dependent oxidoreductase, partial [Pseudobdellovibrionaceae bacterium]|nr:FAD-dependent oxidoreductase [Pseudobdellovibrionaceae bacterium]
MENMRKLVGVIGAGPAGLTAAYLLCKRGINVVVLEADPHYVGGISRTVQYKGYHFDIGGHRFFSKAQEVEDLWTELLPDDMLDRPRLSRIYYNGQYFSYPLKAFEALTKLGIIQSVLCVLSYLKARAFPVKDPKNFEEWTTNQFGKRLFNIFFKTYTEKVWGMSCKDISADWAAQRIKGLSLGRAILHAFLPKKRAKKGPVIKTLIDTFRYPRKGPGMLWEACAAKVLDRGGEILMGHKVKSLQFCGDTWKIVHQGPNGKEQSLVVDE